MLIDVDKFILGNAIPWEPVFQFPGGLGFKTVSLGMSLCSPFVSKHVLPARGKLPSMPQHFKINSSDFSNFQIAEPRQFPRYETIFSGVFCHWVLHNHLINFMGSNPLKWSDFLRVYSHWTKALNVG